MSVSDVISKIAISRRTLEKRFQKFVGNSIYSMIQQERIKRIEQLLVDTNMTIAEIAYDMDFSDPCVLTRFFTKYRIMSPSSFRKKYKMGFSG